MPERGSYAISRADGSPLYYSLREPVGRSEPAATVVLSDGIGCDGYVWKYLKRDLAANYRVIHWHYPGHGRSPMPRRLDRVAIPDLADDLADVLDDCGIERAVLFGHSMGVQVTLETCRRHPQRVDAMVLLCGMAENPLRTFRGTGALEEVLPAARYVVDRAPRVLRGLVRRVLPTRLAYTVATRVEVNGELLDAADFMPYLRGLSRIEPHLFLTMLEGAGRHSAMDFLPQVAAPTLVVGGDRDGFTPPALSRKIAEAIPGAELALVERGSHTAPLERPRFVDRIVLEFLERRLAAPGRRADTGAAGEP
jgi:pimeloyl-ACP methyl ester carboxylesterase